MITNPKYEIVDAIEFTRRLKKNSKKNNKVDFDNWFNTPDYEYVKIKEYAKRAPDPIFSTPQKVWAMCINGCFDCRQLGKTWLIKVAKGYLLPLQEEKE